MIIVHFFEVLLVLEVIRHLIRTRRTAHPKRLSRPSPRGPLDPITILQERYACGDLSLRDFTIRIERLLQSLDR